MGKISSYFVLLSYFKTKMMLYFSYKKEIIFSMTAAVKYCTNITKNYKFSKTK